MAFTRKDIRTKLREQVARKEPIILGGAGIGLVAKAADRAGIDLIMAYNTGPFRMDGAASLCGYLPYGDANAITMQLGNRMLKLVKNTPVIAGVGASDPYRNIPRFIDELMEMGFSGITNVPALGSYEGVIRDQIDELGYGVPEEVKMIGACSRKDIFTVAYAFTEQDVRDFVAAGVDIVGVHVGGTSGGMVGTQKTRSIESACEMTQRYFEIAMKENPDVFVVTHGGPFEDPESVRQVFQNTDVHGFIGASSIERIPVERAVTQVVTEFKGLRLR